MSIEVERLAGPLPDFGPARVMRVVTIIDRPPITIIEVNRVIWRKDRVPVASSLLSRIVVPFPLVSRWRNGERTDDLAQTLVDHGTSFCVEPQRPCSRSLAMLKVSPPSSRCGHDLHRRT